MSLYNLLDLNISLHLISPSGGQEITDEQIDEFVESFKDTIEDFRLECSECLNADCKLRET